MQGFLGASFRSFVGRTVGAASALVASFAITSTLEISESGLFFLSLGFALFLSHILKFGLDTFTLKKCSIFLSESKFEDFLSMLLAGIVVSIAGSVLFYTVGRLIEWADIYEYANYLVLAFPAGVAMALMSVVAHSLHAMGFVFTGTVTNISLNYVLFSLCVWVLEPSSAVHAINYFATSCMLALSIQMIVAATVFWRDGVLVGHPNLSLLSKVDFREIYVTTLPLWIVVCCQQLNLWAAQFISSVYVEQGEIALLAIAMRVTLVVPMLLTSVNLVVSPQFASLFHKGEIRQLETVLERSLKLLAIVSLATGLFVAVFGASILSIFGPEYADAHYLLIILVCGQLVNSLAGPSGMLLMMSGFEKDIRNSSIVVTFFGLFLAFILTRFFGIYGAAIATALTIAAQNIFFVFLVKLRVNISIPAVYRNILRPST